MNLKEKKYLLLDLDGVCYGKHNNYSLEKVFGQVSNRMTKFISERLKIDLKEAKKLQTDYFYKYNTVSCYLPRSHYSSHYYESICICSTFP